MPSKPASAASVSSSAARVWITTGFPSYGGELELRVEEPPLRIVRGVVAEVVEPGLPHGDGALVARAAPGARRSGRRPGRPPRADGCRGSRRHPGGYGVSSSVRAPSTIVVETAITRSTPTSAARASTSGASLEVEMRVGVDHARLSSSSTIDASSLRKSGIGSSSVWPGGSSLGCQLPIQLA